MTTDDEDGPWCASFINYTQIESGNPSNSNQYNATASGYRYSNEYNPISKPAMGCIAIVMNGNHVTYVIAVKNGYVHGLGGNQSNQVKISTYSIEDVRFRYPKGEIPNYNVPTLNYNFSPKKESIH